MKGVNINIIIYINFTYSCKISDCEMFFPGMFFFWYFFSSFSVFLSSLKAAAAEEEIFISSVVDLYTVCVFVTMAVLPKIRGWAPNVSQKW